MPSRLRTWWFLAVALAICTARSSWGQSPQVPLPPPPGSGPLVPVPGASSVPTSPSFGGGITAPPSTTLGPPTFDPYSGAAPSLNAPPPSSAFGAQPAAPSVAPWNRMPPSAPQATPYGAAPSGTSPYGTAPYGTAPYGTAPYGTTPYGAAPTSPFGSPPGATPAPWGAPAASPYGAAPGSPQGASLFPNGIFPQNPNTGAPPLRLFDNLRLRETWIYGDSGQELGINDIETAVTMMLPNFLGTKTPLMLSPNFALHLWDGPAPPAHTQFMPGNAYSAYLEAAYNTDHAQALGADLSASVGVFTDFETFTSESIRIQTLSYGWARLTPNMMLKLGVNYLDRVDIKILPAFGILYEPNPQTRLDIFFPRPKLSHMFSTMGTTDIWWYIGAEYGGGSWSINYAPSGFVDQVDINDIRVVLGFDWTNQSGTRGMFEVGWVTSRDLVYRGHPADNISLNDTIMVRGGFAF